MAECQDGNQGSGIAMASDSQFSEITSPASEAGPFFPPLRARAARSRAARLDLASDPPSLRDLYPAQVIARLQVHPRLPLAVEVACGPHGWIRGNCAPAPPGFGCTGHR